MRGTPVQRFCLCAGQGTGAGRSASHAAHDRDSVYCSTPKAQSVTTDSLATTHPWYFTRSLPDPWTRLDTPPNLPPRKQSEAPVHIHSITQQRAVHCKQPLFISLPPRNLRGTLQARTTVSDPAPWPCQLPSQGLLRRDFFLREMVESRGLLQAAHCPRLPTCHTVHFIECCQDVAKA